MGEKRSPVRGRLAVDDRKTGRVWVATIVRADGKPTRRVLGPAWVRDSGKRTPRGAIIWRAASGSKPDDTYLTPRDAEEQIEQLLTAERARPRQKRGASGKTWGDASRGWIQRVENVRDGAPTTLATYRASLSQLKGEGLPADLPLHRLNAARLERLQDGLLARVDPKLPRFSTKKLEPGETPEVTRLSRKTIANRMLVVSGVIGYALSRGWLSTDPRVGVEIVGAPAPSPDFNVLEPSELEAVARAVAEVTQAERDKMINRDGKLNRHALKAAQDARAMWAEMIRVAGYTGQRFGELRALRWRDVDFTGEVIRTIDNLPSSSPAGSEVRSPKSKKGRGVPLIAPAIAALDRVSQMGRPTGPDDLVFPNLNGGMQDVGRVRDAFYAALKRAGLGHLRERTKPIVLHDLRHTFGTIAVRVFPVSDVQAWMGHADISTTMRYVHHVPRTDAAAKLTEAFSTDVGVRVADPARSTA